MNEVAWSWESSFSYRSTSSTQDQRQSQTSRLVKMSALAKSLQDAKVLVADHSKSLPDGAAEHEDYVTWGHKFLKRLVSVFTVVARY
jgi:hypothetical protein